MKNNEEAAILFNGKRITVKDFTTNQTWQQALRLYAADHVGKLDQMVELTDADAAAAVNLVMAKCTVRQQNAILAKFRDGKRMADYAAEMGTRHVNVEGWVNCALETFTKPENFPILNFGEWELFRRQKVEAEKLTKAKESYTLQWVYRLKKKILDSKVFPWPVWSDIRKEAEAIEKAINALSPNVRDSLLGFYRDGKTVTQIAEELGLSVKSVYSYCNERGLFYLSRSKYLAQYINEPEPQPITTVVYRSADVDIRTPGYDIDALLSGMYDGQEKNSPFSAHAIAV